MAARAAATVWLKLACPVSSAVGRPCRKLTKGISAKVTTALAVSANWPLRVCKTRLYGVG